MKSSIERLLFCRLYKDRAILIKREANYRQLIFCN